jgi:short-subunit dehydrogenase
MGRSGAMVVGASAGVGRALADELARTGHDLVLVARDDRDLDALAADLSMRHGVKVTPFACDLANDDTAFDEVISVCRGALEELVYVLFPIGTVDDADDGLTAWATSERILATNLSSVLRLSAVFLSELAGRRGTVVFFSSIAAAAPRRRNVVYSAAKAALESYARSLRHRFAGSEVAIQVYALGYVDTTMTFGRPLLLPKADPARIAHTVVRNLDAGPQFRYLPRWWGPIVRVLSVLPWPIYRRLDF